MSRRFITHDVWAMTRLPQWRLVITTDLKTTRQLPAIRVCLCYGLVLVLCPKPAIHFHKAPACVRPRSLCETGVVSLSCLYSSTTLETFPVVQFFLRSRTKSAVVYVASRASGKQVSRTTLDLTETSVTWWCYYEYEYLTET
jgi:hypothetical protein